MNTVFFGEPKGLLFNAFKNAASINRVFKYYQADITCSKEAGVSELGSLVAVVRQFDEAFMVYTGEPEQD